MPINKGMRVELGEVRKLIRYKLNEGSNESLKEKVSEKGKSGS